MLAPQGRCTLLGWSPSKELNWRSDWCGHSNGATTVWKYDIVGHCVLESRFFSLVIDDLVKYCTDILSL